MAGPQTDCPAGPQTDGSAGGLPFFRSLGAASAPVIEIPPADFPVADPGVISAVAFVAQGPPGPVSFALDDLESR